MTPPRGRSATPRAELDAERLVRRAQAGDRRAFGELSLRYRPRLLALALHLSGSRSDAEDIVQDTLLRAWGRLSEFQGRSQFFTWLYRITLNRALNHRRDSGRRRRVTVHDDRIVAALAVDAAGDPEKAVELSEVYAALLSALDELSPSLRATVVLVALQGLTHRQAARMLETTESTVGWRMHEARKQLQAVVARPRPRQRRSITRLLERLEQLLSPAGEPAAATAIAD